MRARKRLGFEFLILISIVVAFSCSSRRDKEIATVGDGHITVGDVADVMSGGGYEETEQGASEALAYLIDFRLILMEAKAEGYGESEEFDTKMQAATDQLLIRKLMEVEIYDKAIPTVEEARAKYEERGGNREEIRVRHILLNVPSNATEEEKAEKRAKLEEILGRVRAGEDFGELAKKFSEGPSAHRGGDLGFHPKGSIDPDFEKVVFTLEPGEVSDVFQTRFGYHIAKLEEKRVRTFDMMKDKLMESMEVSSRLTLSKDYMADVEKRSNLQYVDEGIDRVIKLFEEDPTGGKARDEAPVLAVFEGGKWTGAQYAEYYMSQPETLRVAPKDPSEVKRNMAPRVKDAVLAHEARQEGIDQLPEFQEELQHLREDVLVQMFITRQLFGGEPDEEVLLSLYNESRDEFPGSFEEERENVLKMHKDKMEEGGLENLTAPLKDKYAVTITKENLRYVPTVLKG